MRIVLVGAVESSQVALRTLVDCGRAPVGVLTLPRDLAGRHSDFADLARPAIKAGAEIVLAADINSAESLEALRRLSPDLVLVVGWSQICGREFRSIAALGAVGFHPSALPKMRGRAVIPWTILRDEKETASTLFWLDAGTDSGDIIAQSFFPVAPAETARSLYARHLANLSAMLPQALTHIASGTAPRLPQDHSKATYCARRRPEDGFIDWMGTTAGTLRLVRAVGDPYPGAYGVIEGKRMVVREAVAVLQRFIGMPGQIQAHEDGGFVVSCGDGGNILVRSWEGPALPRIHARFELRR